MSVEQVPRQLAGDELVQFAAELAAARPAPSRRTPPVAGGRFYEIAWEDESVNAWLIGWSGAADTGFHDHDSSAAGIVVLEGVLVEERLALGRRPIQRRFGAGESFWVPPSAIHRVRHGAGKPALSIHAYSPPLRSQGVYRVAADRALERTSVSYTEELRAEPAIA